MKRAEIDALAEKLYNSGRKPPGDTFAAAPKSVKAFYRRMARTAIALTEVKPAPKK